MFADDEPGKVEPLSSNFDKYPALPVWLLNASLLAGQHGEVFVIGVTKDSDIYQMLELNQCARRWNFVGYVGPTLQDRIDKAFLEAMHIAPDLECKKISEDDSFLLAMHINPALYQDYGEPTHRALLEKSKEKL